MIKAHAPFKINATRRHTTPPATAVPPPPIAPESLTHPTPTEKCESRGTLRPVKVQQRTSGGAWRTLQGLIDFAIVQSYLDTATKWGIDKLHALRQLFTTGPWLPPALTPAE